MSAGPALLPRWPRSLGAVAALGLLHLGLALVPGLGLEPETNVLLFAANLYVAYGGWLVFRDGRLAAALGFAAGYLALLGLLLLVLERESLFVLLAIAWASVYRVPVLRWLVLLFVLCYVVLQPYAFECFLPLALAVLAVHGLRRTGADRFRVACLSLGLFVLAALLLPVLHLVSQDSPQTLLATLARPDVLDALGSSLATAGLATLLVLLGGVPLAYALARGRFRGRGAVEVLVDLPILIPQSVVGVAILVLLGPGSPLGRGLEELGLGVAGRFAGVVLVQAFVSYPFLVKAALTAFEGVPTSLEDASRSLGVGPWGTFWRVSLPLAARGVLTGVALAFARAVSEFGALLLVAPQPETGPVLVHRTFLQGGVADSRPVAVVLVLVCLWVFVLLQFGRAFLPGAPRGGAGEVPR
ncbi:MAG TPA: ABC transporter permease [Myxococcota bacterium]|nr:ABC transporter permease [Myxococcota bacterium]HRY93745.1 ABC transporter permease [Myxococcota bacterium]